VPRPLEEWIAIAVPPVICEQTFEAAAAVRRDNSKWSPRRAEPGQWMLRGLVKCGACAAGCNCRKMRGRNGTWHRYYHCRNHDPIKAGGASQLCPERNIRADALDTFVFGQVRAALLRPDVLLAGEQALAVRTPAPDDELLTAELARLARKKDAAQAERKRLADLYQAGLTELTDMQQRATEIGRRHSELTQRHASLTEQRHELTRDNQLRHRVGDFAQRVLAVTDTLSYDHKQALLRLVVEEVRVTGWHVEIRLRIPLDDTGGPPPASQNPGGSRPPRVSTEDRLRSIGRHQRRFVPHAPGPSQRRNHPEQTLISARGGDF